MKSNWAKETWWWASITREEEPETNANRCEAILTAHGIKVDISDSDPANGCYLIVLPRFPESVEVLEIQMRVGELEVVIET